MANALLWVYIVLLLVGGLMGYFKAGSKVSLITSGIFALLLTLVAAGMIAVPWAAEGLMVVLLVVFIARYAKTKKFMPAGLMILLTAIFLILRFVASGPAAAP
jgi:uncharacterized membrane protein (UPF0136 family)